MPINQVAMQMSSIVMALAGAERIFKLIDEPEEENEGDEEEQVNYGEGERGEDSGTARHVCLDG